MPEKRGFPNSDSLVDLAVWRMDESLIAEMREALESRRSELLALVETGEESAQTVELDQQRVGRLSRMDAMQAQAMAKASRLRSEAALRGIAAALSRIDNEDFGYCFDCEEPIPINRLRFDPSVRLCIQCANKAETR